MLLTRSPLSTGASSGFSFDLHVLSTPPAFVLSQDQTLRKGLFGIRLRGEPSLEAAPRGLFNLRLLTNVTDI